MKEMSSRERMLAALRRESHDRVPFSPYIGNNVNSRFDKALRWGSQFERAECMLELNLDPAIDIWNPSPVPDDEVEIKTWREKKDNEILLTKEFHTPAGVLRQVVRETSDWCETRHGPWVPTTLGDERRQEFGIHLFDDYNVSRRVEPWVKGREDLDALRYVLRNPRDWRLDEWRMDACRALDFARDHNLLTVARRLVVGDAFQWFCDITDFLVKLYEDPDFVRDFFDIFQSWAMDILDLFLELDVDVVQYRGWYEIPTYFGPHMWAAFIEPYIRAQAELVRRQGKFFSYLLPEGQGAYAEQLKRMPIDVHQGVDPRMLRGGDFCSLYTHLGNSQSFWGGVNAEVTLQSSDPEMIEREVIEAIRVLDADNGLILSSFIFPEVPEQGLRQLLSAWRKHCRKI